MYFSLHLAPSATLLAGDLPHCQVEMENEIQMRSPFRQAPHTDAATKLKEFVNKYSFEEEDHWVKVGRHCGLADHGYIENIFPVVLRPENNPHENYDYNILYGYVYKKDKKSDHVPIPMAKALGAKRKTSRLKQRKENFIAFPVPMPFRALTWTRTFVALDLKSGMFWYCDNITNKGWAKNMKWVTPQEVRPWFTFGTYDEDQNLLPRACGFQMKSQGYKTFTFLTDSYSNQEIWMEKFSQSIKGNLSSNPPAAHTSHEESKSPSPTSSPEQQIHRMTSHHSAPAKFEEKKSSGDKMRDIWKRQGQSKESQKK